VVEGGTADVSEVHAGFIFMIGMSIPYKVVYVPLKRRQYIAQPHGVTTEKQN
jgi:hypothetical protein